MFGRREWVVAIGGLLAVHLAADLLILFYGAQVCVARGVLSLAVLAIPTSQVSLVAIGVMASQLRSYWRLPLVVIALAWLWYVESAAMDMAYRDWLAVPHIVALAVQAAVVLAVLILVQVVARLLAGRRHTGDDRPAPRWQYTLFTLLAWTTMVGIVLGVARLTCLRCGWDLTSVKNLGCAYGAIVGVYNGAFGLVLAAPLLVSRPRWLRVALIPVSAALVVLGAASQGYVLQTIVGHDFDVTSILWMALAAFQAFYVLGTLLSVRAIAAVVSGWKRAEPVGSQCDAA